MVRTQQYSLTQMYLNQENQALSYSKDELLKKTRVDALPILQHEEILAETTDLLDKLIIGERSVCSYFFLGTNYHLFAQ